MGASAREWSVAWDVTRTGRKSTSDTGVYLRKHKHSWSEIGSRTWPSGDRCPTFRCRICGDVICDLSVNLNEE